MRSTVRALGALLAVLLVVAVSLVAGTPGARAAAGVVQRQHLAISITGMTPAFAGPNSTVTLHGTLANHTGSSLSGIAVHAATSSEVFQYPAQMTEFADSASAGASALPLEQAGSPYAVASSVPNGTTVNWTVSFRAADFYSQFGVYPVEVQVAAYGSTYTTDARTYLPYWPGGSGAAQPKGLQAAWVWPLIDTPQQGACPQTLSTSGLASSVASGGRLRLLLTAGSAWAQADNLTWDIDPALLSDVSVMTKPYFTHGNAVCSGRFTEPANQAATKWLSQLRTSTDREPAFLTPYANVDVAALSHAGLDSSVEAAYRLGETVAGQVLPSTFGVNGTGTGDGAVLKAAWPADGLADAQVLTSLANDGGIGTVVVSSDELPPPPVGEDALARTASGVGTTMSVLLANSRITSLLGTASATATPAGQFTFIQDFIAQTAMIAAELPSTARSLVIAPPPNWNPSPAEVNALLSITHTAPWLHSLDLSKLAAAAGKLPSTTHVTAKQVSGTELSEAYLDRLIRVDGSVSLVENLMYQPAADQLNSLDAAVASAESSAWRGRASPGGWLAMSQLAYYLTDSEHKVQLIASQKILLAGQSGKAAVSVLNGLDVPVRVQVTARTPPGSQLEVKGFDAPLTCTRRSDPGNGSTSASLVPAVIECTVQPGQTNTVFMQVHSAASGGTTTMRLQLTTRSGSPLAWTAKPLSVEVTRFGRSLLIIIGGALGILVLTSVYRLRRKRLAGAKNGGNEETADAGGAG